LLDLLARAHRLAPGRIAASTSTRSRHARGEIFHEPVSHSRPAADLAFRQSQTVGSRQDVVEAPRPAIRRVHAPALPCWHTGSNPTARDSCAPLKRLHERYA